MRLVAIERRVKIVLLWKGMSLLARSKHFFIPSEKNNFRAKALHYSSLTSFGLLFLAFQLAVSTFVILKPQVLGFASQISPARVIELTNQERAKVGASALVLNSLLSEAAQRKAGDMFAFGYWAHNSPSGRSPWDFFKEVGYRFSSAGENLARDFASPEAVVAAWMASPTHKDNILNPNYREIGLAVVDGNLGGVETTLVVQHFATPVVAVAQKPAVPPQVPEEAVAVEETPVPVEVKPEEVPQEAVALPEATGTLAQATGKEKRLINPFALTQKGALGLVGGLLLVIGIDGIWIWRKKVFRLSGHALAHGIFLFSILLLILFSSQGAIL